MATKRALTADEQAVAAAEEMFKAKGAGGMPATPEGGLSDEGTRISESSENVAMKAQAAKSDDGDEDDEDEDEDEGEGEDEMEKTKKSLSADDETIGSDQLLKALSTLEATAEGVDEGAIDRRTELAERFASGELSKSEREELVSLLGGEDEDDGSPFAKSVSEEFSSDEQLARDYDVSEFIERQSQLMAKALDDTRDGILSVLQKSEARQSDFNRALAKSFQGIGKVVLEQQTLIKSQQAQLEAMGQRLGVVENTPLPRKTRTGAVPLRKSFGDLPAPDGGLSPADIRKGLETLMIKSRDTGRIGVGPGGYDIAAITAQYESTHSIPSSALRDVAAVLGRGEQLQ